MFADKKEKIDFKLINFTKRLFETLENSKGWKNCGEMVRVGGEVEWIKGITGRFVRNFLTFTFSPSRRRISHVRAPRGRLISRKGSGGRS